MPLAYGLAGFTNVPPPAISGNGAPPASFKGQLGQQYFDTSQTPPVLYIYNGQTWSSGGDTSATTTSPGSVTLSTLAQLEAGTAPSGAYVPLANDVFTFVNSVVIAGANKATESSVGLIQEATDAQAVAGTNLNPGTPLAVQPKSLAAVFAANPAIGGTTPAAALFTTIGASGLASLSGSATILSAGTAISIGTDASADAINIGTGAAARAITLGNSTSTTSIALNVGTGSSLNLGTNAIAHTVTIGNITGATAVNINAGTGGSTYTTTNGSLAFVTGT